MRVYVESTIPSYFVARPARNLLQAAREQLTRDWWSLERQKHELFVSQIVRDEIANGEAAMAQARLELIKDLPILDLTTEAETLAATFISSGVLPSFASADAAHIALAAAHKMDILLTWNCRHIANASIQIRLRRLAASEQVDLPLLCTPDEFFPKR